MPEREEEKTGIWRSRIQEAIKLAQENRWQEAVMANQGIIEVFPNDVDAYNRLGRAYIELGEYNKAREAYSKALELSPSNSIAKKNLDRLVLLKGANAVKNEQRRKLPPSAFIPDTGKAGVVNLLEIAPKSVLVKMTPSEQVFLKIRGHDIAVENYKGEYLGLIEPEHGLRLAKLIQGGNQYIAGIISLDNDKVKVMIRETLQHPSQTGKLSFPLRVAESYPAHVKDSLLRHSAGEDEGLEETEYAEGEESEAMPEGFSIYEGYTSPDDIRRLDGNYGDEE
ncbi:MAG: tetratricopeptide repeat protein [Dehalococcoidia bacterium]|nr:tetratricopeptide repeat protein [Dehalococcoidia bacterium]